MGICPKVNIIAPLGFELAYYDSVVHCFNHYTTGIPPWSLSDCKSPQVSWTLLSILNDFNNAVVWMVFTRSVFSKSSSPCINPIFVAASHQTRLDTRSKARRPIKVGIKGRGRSGTSRDSNPACQCCSSAHFVQCEPDEASSFTNPNVGPGTYA